MRPKVFVAQATPEAALDVLRQAADVSVYPYLERQISVDELVGAAKRSDWLYVLHETSVTAEVINANPNLKGIGCMAAGHSFIDMAAANARKIPVVMGDPDITVIPATGDLTIAMLLGLAYRLVDFGPLHALRQLSPGADRGDDGHRMPGQDGRHGWDGKARFAHAAAPARLRHACALQQADAP